MFRLSNYNIYLIILLLILGFSGCDDNISQASLPIPPSYLQATVASQNQINLSWADNSNNEEGFKIERRTESEGNYSLIKNTYANAISSSDTGLYESTAYSYRVYAYNSAGNSDYSNEATATTLSRVTSVSAGYAHTCALLSSGGVKF